jgi:hypothetical protein
MTELLRNERLLRSNDTIFVWVPEWKSRELYMAKRRANRISRPRNLLKSQKHHGPAKYHQQSKKKKPKNPPVEGQEPQYRSNFKLIEKEGAETLVERIIRRGAATSRDNRPPEEPTE